MTDRTHVTSPPPPEVPSPSPEPTTTAGETSARTTLLLACGAAFLAFLDLSVVNIAFPALTRDYPETPATTLTWVVSGYAVAFAALLTPAGALADNLGRRRVFRAALIGFALTSLLCALAPSAPWLIAGRLAQGATAALMVPSALGAVLANTPRERIGAAFGAWSAAGGFAAVIGPAVGGALVELFGWRAVFVINVPVALMLALLAGRISDTVQRRGTPPDPLGTVALALGLGALVAAVTEGHTWGWTAPGTLIALAGGILLLGVALYRSSRHPAPAVAVTLWRDRHYALANAGSFVFGAVMFAWLLSGPLFLDLIWEYSTFGAAAALTAGALASMVTATMAGRITDARRRAIVGLIGALLFASALAWMSTDAFDTDPALWSAWIPAGLLGGGGVGIVVTVLGTAAATTLPPERFAAGVAMNLTARQVGGAFGIAVFAAVFAAHPNDPLGAFHLSFTLGAVTAVIAAFLIALPALRPLRTEG